MHVVEVVCCMLCLSKVLNLYSFAMVCINHAFL